MSWKYKLKLIEQDDLNIMNSDITKDVIFKLALGYFSCNIINECINQGVRVRQDSLCFLRNDYIHNNEFITYKHIDTVLNLIQHGATISHYRLNDTIFKKIYLLRRKIAIKKIAKWAHDIGIDPTYKHCFILKYDLKQYNDLCSIYSKNPIKL